MSPIEYFNFFTYIKMSILSLVADAYNNLLKLNNIEIIILFDDANNVWLSYNELLNALGYKDAKTQKRRISLDNKYFDTFKNIYSKSSLNKFDKNKVSHRLKMINESGLYILLYKSNKDIAKKLAEKFFSEVLPELRKTGKYILDKSDSKYKKQITKKIQLYQQELKRTRKYTYTNKTGKGFIYVIKIKTSQDGKEKKCYKIGYTANLEKRMATYKTGNPDIELEHYENINCNKKQLEKCIINLNILKLLKNKTEVICDTPLEKIKNEIEECKKLINKFTKS